MGAGTNDFTSVSTLVHAHSGICSLRLQSTFVVAETLGFNFLDNDVEEDRFP